MLFDAMMFVLVSVFYFYFVCRLCWCKGYTRGSYGEAAATIVVMSDILTYLINERRDSENAQFYKVIHDSHEYK